MKSIQCPQTVMMVRPSHFGYNSQTAGSNTFQNRAFKNDLDNISKKALEEFDGLVHKLRSKGIEVMVYDDDHDIITPDAIFPNNWVSFQPDGRLVLYSMMAENRRLEKRTDILDHVKKSFTITEIVDLSDHEAKGEFLEGTGSIIFDHVNKVAYANESLRTNELLFLKACDQLDHEPVFFQASDTDGIDIYHTNVMMSIGERHCIICLEAIDLKYRSYVVEKLKSGGLEILNITYEQMYFFAGNMIQLENKLSEKILVMSESAYNSLDSGQIDFLESYSTLLHSDLQTIESIGGGSARCMIAGIHLPLKEY